MSEIQNGNRYATSKSCDQWCDDEGKESFYPPVISRRKECSYLRKDRKNERRRKGAGA